MFILKVVYLLAHRDAFSNVLGYFVRFHSSSFLIWSGQKILNIFLRHLLI